MRTTRFVDLRLACDRGDVERFASLLLQRYGGQLRCYLARKTYGCSPPPDVDAMLDDVVLQLCERVQAGTLTLRREHSFESYLYRAALYTASARVRRRRNRVVAASRIEDCMGHPEYEESSYSRVENAEEIARVVEALDALPTEDRRLIHLWLRRVSMRRIAWILGISENAAHLRKRRIIETLRLRLMAAADVAV